MKIQKEMFDRVVLACTRANKILSRTEIMQLCGCSEATARAIQALLENQHLFTETERGGDKHIRFAITADVHIGNKAHAREAYIDFLQRANECCDFLVVAGDLIDGNSVYRGQVYEVAIPRLDEQVAAAQEVLTHFSKPIYYILGNHEYASKRDAGVNIASMLTLPNIHILGEFAARVEKDGVTIHVVHGNGGNTYAITHKAQKYVDALQHHVDFVVVGHYHTAAYFIHRGVHCFLAGAFCVETPLTKRLGVTPNICGWLVEAHITAKKMTVSAHLVTYNN